MKTPSKSPLVPALSWLAAFGVAFVLAVSARAQTTVTESFTGTTASGWVFGGASGSTAPYLTANTVDTPGNGWLRLTENLNNQATYALFDSAIFSVNAQIQIDIDYAFYNGSGADGITFFLVDGSVNSSSFSAGAYGGSMGYAQKTGIPGMVGGYLGFALDDFGNYSNPTEGRVGGTGFVPNAIAVRASETDNYAFIAGSGDLSTLSGGGQMDFPTYTARPNQTGADFRSFRLTLDANNQLTVQMRFGSGSTYITAFTADLSAYDRPETFKIGFTGATGGSTEIHEVRNVSVTMTPWQPTAYEWDNGAGATKAWTTGTNWAGDVAPGVNADILFGNKPTTGQNQTVTLDTANTKVNSLTFDSGFNYTVNGTGSLVMGDTSVAGLPSININDYNGAQAQHHLNLPVTLAETLTINNYSFSTLCLNGAITTGGNDIKVNGNGATNFNADINGSGNLIKNGTGIVTINSNNADGATPWTGNVTINGGMVVVTADGALGTTAGTTTVANGGVLAFRAASGNVAYATGESVTISGNGLYRGGEGLTGAIYNDGGTNSFAGNITLAASSGLGSRSGTLTLSGVISDGASTFGVTKFGDGVIDLSNASNAWNGTTTIADGVLRVSTSSNALAGGFTTNGYTGGNLTLAGGVLEINVATSFTRQLGTGSDQVQWTGDGGFSAYGANRTVALVNSGGTANGTLTWNAGSFVPTGNALLLSSDYANAMITMSNAINLGGASREVRVANGSATVDATLSGIISNGGLIKSGAGTLDISNTGNSYTGATEIRGGALRGTVSTSSNITLNGGVLELGANFTRSLGTGGTNVQWTGDGGFSAYGANRTVNIGGSGATLTWGSTASFLGASSKLILGSSSSTNTLTFANALDLNAGARTIQMQNGSAAIDGLLSGVVSNGSLNVIGAGRLDSTAANTLAGTLTVRGAEFRLQSGGTMTSVTNLTVRDGGAFTLDNATGANNTNRVNNAATVTLGGGTFNFLGSAATSSETIGGLTLDGGANTVNVQRNGTFSSQLTFASLTRNAGSTVDFTNAAGGGTLGTAGTNPRVIFTSNPTLTSNVLGYATVNGTAFAGYNATNGIVAVAGTDTAQGSWTTSINATNTADQTLTAARTVGSLSLGSGIDVNAGGNTLTVDSGGILKTGATASIISNGTIRAGTGVSDLVTHVYGAGGLEVSAVVADNGSAKNLIKTGDGVLTLSGTSANTFTGTTYVNDGTLALNKTAGVNAINGNLIVGDGRGTDTLRLDADEQIANTANLTLRGGVTGTGETVLKFNGASGVGVTETLGTLTIDGRSVIDFAGGNVCDANFLFLDDLLMASPDSMLYIRNWIDFTDFLLVRNTADIGSVLSRIYFEGYGTTSYWQEYDASYRRITPVPEPSTYGAILMAVGLVVFASRRIRRVRAKA